MIKKEMHFFWGTSAMSWMRMMTLLSFRRLNPDWKMVLHICWPQKDIIAKKTWTDSPAQDFFNYTNADNYIDKVEALDVEIRNWNFEEEVGGKLVGKLGPSHMSNFFKWKLLANENVFYSDMDILYVLPLKEYYEEVKDQDTVICYHNGHFSIGFMASSGNNAFYQAVFENASRCCTPTRYQSAGVTTLHNTLARAAGIKKRIIAHDMWAILEKHYPAKNYNNPMELVYPWRYNQMSEVFYKDNFFVPKGCLGIHWYAGSKEAQEYNNLLTKDTYKEYVNTFTEHARRMG